jgi:hypothetical protein
MIEGFYFDPWHGGCLRRISKTKKNHYKIHGVYGNDERIRLPKNVEYHTETSDQTNKYWYATLEVYENEANLYYLNVYFGGKPGKKRLHYNAVYDSKKRVIKWDDTNTWKQMYHHKKQLF